MSNESIKEVVANLLAEIGWDDLLKELELIAFNRYTDRGKTEGLYYGLFLDIHNARAEYNGKKDLLSNKIGFGKHE